MHLLPRRALLRLLGVATAYPVVAKTAAFAADPAGCTAANALRGGLEPAFKAAVADLPVIDAHAHVINARDVPVYEFMILIINNVTNFDAKKVDQAKNLGQYLRYNLETIENAPTVEQDREALDFLRASRARDGYPGTPPRIGAMFDGVMNGSNDAFRKAIAFKKYGSEVHRGDAVSVAQLNEVVPAFRRRWLPTGVDDFTGGRGPAAFRGTFSRITDGDFRLERGVVSNFTAKKGYSYARLQDFLWCLERSRIRNFQDLRRVYGAANAARRPKGRPGVASFSVAMLDFDYWLNSEAIPHAPKSVLRWRKHTQSPLEKQIGLMSDLAALYPGEAQPLVPFCPWRQADDRNGKSRRRTTALRLVEQAMTEGFVGVKIYPPMGFRPWNNTDFDKVEGALWPSHYLESRDTRYKYGQAFGAELDQSMAELYDFCARHDFPIMTHTGLGNAARRIADDGPKQRQSSGELANPLYWRLVLEQEKWKNLRINLAHFGFFRADWRHDIGVLMRRYPNVFADLGHFQELLLKANCDWAKCFFDAILAKGAFRDRANSDVFSRDIKGDGAGPQCEAAFLKKDLSDPVDAGAETGARGAMWRRLMYGSDWFMVLKEYYSEDYLDVVSRGYFNGVGDETDRDALLKAFLSGNAASFFGYALTEAGSRRKSQNRERLEAFYKARAGWSEERVQDRFRPFDDVVAGIAAADASYWPTYT